MSVLYRVSKKMSKRKSNSIGESPHKRVRSTEVHDEDNEVGPSQPPVPLGSHTVSKLATVHLIDLRPL